GGTPGQGPGTVGNLSEGLGAGNRKGDFPPHRSGLRCNDRIKAVAFGGKAVNIRKPQGWGLAAGGSAGLVRVLELLEEELIVDMGLLGVTRIDQIDAKYVCQAPPVTFPHEMSAFIHMPGGQLR